ncbi:ABC transporter ATP-binding protein [Jiangella muralis]|uniref:ABC transporter ATP-binding protein n=1 Tax=Jiangella muralis TaxID=702383 RepID=UPI0009FA06C9|nr:ABC transporter ATP-binding protein [Jiangella muralis]
MTTPALSVRNLRVSVGSGESEVEILRGVDFDVRRGEILGIAGESGSGKTMAMRAVLGLLPHGARATGSAVLDGRDLVGLSQSELRTIRGRHIGMVFQDPTTSLHPMLRIGRQLTDHMRKHLGLRRAEAERRALDLLDDVRLPDPEQAMGRYPHQFSGGMRQRIAIAAALACNPTLIVADEPTTALDVTVQAGVLALLRRLCDEHGTSIVMITHDLGVLSELCDRVSVFYSGSVIESGSTRDVMDHARHPYTRALLDALPDQGLDDLRPMVPIAGTAPSAADRPAGCAFHPRCRFATVPCQTDPPGPRATGPDGAEPHTFSCTVDPFELRSVVR